MAPVLCYLGLGSNLGEKKGNLRKALFFLDREQSVRVCRVAPEYLTAPVGFADQDWFLNTVAEVETFLSPRRLLAVLSGIEEKMGRVREFRWGPRVIDIDILLYGDAVVNEPDLVIPHPEMKKRAFVLVPLADLVPELELPGGGKVAELARQLQETQPVIRAGN
ncbi:MAG: 2-amino-4-hydroxy-6-hydroxymethyldihydropteridine diphosphokinase [Desulfotomaculales bacterium]